jgi:hypothetical protein
MLVTLIEGSKLHLIQEGEVRSGNMDIVVVHANLTDARVVGKLVMRILGPVDRKASWRRLVS